MKNPCCASCKWYLKWMSLWIEVDPLFRKELSESEDDFLEDIDGSYCVRFPPKFDREKGDLAHPEYPIVYHYHCCGEYEPTPNLPGEGESDG